MLPTHIHRSGAAKSYVPDHSEGEESSASNSDWSASKEKSKKAAHLSTHNDVDDQDPPLTSPPQLSAKQNEKGRAKTVQHSNVDQSEDNDDDKNDEDFVKKGRLPEEAVIKAQELGQSTITAAIVIRKEYRKSCRTILIEVGLGRKATHKESPWNQLQTWFNKTVHPTSQECMYIQLCCCMLSNHNHHNRFESLESKTKSSLQGPSSK